MQVVINSEPTADCRSSSPSRDRLGSSSETAELNDAEAERKEDESEDSDTALVAWVRLSDSSTALQPSSSALRDRQADFLVDQWDPKSTVVIRSPLSVRHINGSVDGGADREPDDDVIDLDYGLRPRDRMEFDPLSSPTRRKKSATKTSQPSAQSSPQSDSNDKEHQQQTDTTSVVAPVTAPLYLQDPVFQMAAQFEVFHALVAQRASSHHASLTSAIRLDVQATGSQLQHLSRRRRSTADVVVKPISAPTAFLASQWLGQARTNLQHARDATSWRWRLCNRLWDAAKVLRNLLQLHNMLRAAWWATQEERAVLRASLSGGRDSADLADKLTASAGWACSERELFLLKHEMAQCILAFSSAPDREAVSNAPEPQSDPNDSDKTDVADVQGKDKVGTALVSSDDSTSPPHGRPAFRTALFSRFRSSVRRVSCDAEPALCLFACGATENVASVSNAQTVCGCV